MIKIKQEDYVILHRIVTGLNERAVWEHLMTHNGDYSELLESVPDEFYGFSIRYNLIARRAATFKSLLFRIISTQK